MSEAVIFPAPTEAGPRPARGETTPQPRAAAAVSAGLHAAILAAAIILIRVSVPEEARERRVNLEIVDASRFDPPRPAEPDAARFAPGSAPAPVSRADGMIVAKTLRSDAALGDPRSAEAKAALPLMKSDERMLQLCSIEALEQVAALGDGHAPDLIVTYAMDEVRLQGRTAKAPGAAIRHGGDWYNLRFECDVTPDLEHVAAFAFGLGEAIPEAEWESHNLVAGRDLD